MIFVDRMKKMPGNLNILKFSDKVLMKIEHMTLLTFYTLYQWMTSRRQSREICVHRFPQNAPCRDAEPEFQIGGVSQTSLDVL